MAMPIQVNQRPAQAPPQQQQQQQAPRPPGKDPKQREEFYANIGEAIRTLKREIPQLFQKDLTCEPPLVLLPTNFATPAMLCCGWVPLGPKYIGWNCLQYLT